MVFVFLIFFALAVWFWIDTHKNRESALLLAHQACAEHGVQFLDHSVALRAVRFGRTPTGPALSRGFRFEFSDSGFNRRIGTVWMVRQQAEKIILELSEGRTLWYPQIDPDHFEHSD